MNKRELVDRNVAIARRRRLGGPTGTHAAIAREMGISVTRVRQVCRREADMPPAVEWARRQARWWQHLADTRALPEGLPA